MKFGSLIGFGTRASRINASPILELNFVSFAATFKNGVSLAHDLIAVTVLNERAVHAAMFYWNKNDPELKKGACTSVYIRNDAGEWVIWRDIWN
jgi:hypothetical protein